MLRPIDEFFLALPEPNKSCLQVLRKLILEFDPLMTEQLAYGMPFFYYNRCRCCYLWADTATGQPYIGIVDGKLVTFPGLVQGARKRMKILFVDPRKNIPVKTIGRLLKQTISLYK